MKLYKSFEFQKKNLQSHPFLVEFRDAEPLSLAQVKLRLESARERMVLEKGEQGISMQVNFFFFTKKRNSSRQDL